MTEDAPATAETVTCSRPNKYAKWRALTLTMVYVLMAVHVAHWKVAGTTLAPLELHEVMYTAELGVVTAGFILMALALLSVGVFGRFFCSWGCHIMALQELCSWILKKLHIKPRAVRSRILLFVAPAALFYMFIWPQLTRLVVNTWPSTGSFFGPQPVFDLRIITDAEGWASFVTTDFWRNLPGPGMTALTFLVCGFVIVYLLGSRSFCTYACPYGTLFGLADKVAPGRIMLVGDCDQCGECTAVCTTHLKVHEEIDRFGQVMSSSCLKDLDCVSACPNEALAFRFARPPAFRRGVGKPKAARSEFSRLEEVLLAVMFLATLIVFRGLYSLVPFIMTLGLGIVVAYTTVVTIRVFRKADVRMSHLQLRYGGKLTAAGLGFLVVSAAFAAFFVHSAFIRYHEARGDAAFEKIRQQIESDTPSAPAAELAAALHHMEVQERWGLVRTPGLNEKLASLYLVAGPPEKAEVHLRNVIHHAPADYDAHLRLGTLLASQGRDDEAVAELERAAQAVPAHPKERGRAAHVRYSARMALSDLLIQRGQLSEGAEALRAALELEPESAPAHYNLGVVLAMLDRGAEAEQEMRQAVLIDPADPQAQHLLGLLLARRGDLPAAEARFSRALELDPQLAASHYNLAQVLLETGRAQEAEVHLRRAAQLDPHYAVTGEPDSPFAR